MLWRYNQLKSNLKKEIKLSVFEFSCIFVLRPNLSNFKLISSNCEFYAFMISIPITSACSIIHWWKNDKERWIEIKNKLLLCYEFEWLLLYYTSCIGDKNSLIDKFVLCLYNVILINMKWIQSQIGMAWELSAFHGGWWI